MLQSLSFLALFVVAPMMISSLPVPDGTWPVSIGNVTFSEAYIIKSGEVFDGKMHTFDRFNLTCHGQEESGNSTAVFLLEPGATLKNAIIGENQMEGVHCDYSDCIIENVWWEDVCEDALSIKGGNASSVSKVLGGGARYADDKVVQHNGFGTVIIDGFYAQDFGKLYRSCGNCKSNPRQRFVNVSNIYVDLENIKTNRTNPNVSIVMMNGNFGDEAVLHNIYLKPSTENYTECSSAIGVNYKTKPVVASIGPNSPVCQYSYDDVHIVQDNQQEQLEKPQQYEDQTHEIFGGIHMKSESLYLP